MRISVANFLHYDSEQVPPPPSRSSANAGDILALKTDFTRQIAEP